MQLCKMNNVSFQGKYEVESNDLHKIKKRQLCLLLCSVASYSYGKQVKVNKSEKGLIVQMSDFQDNRFEQGCSSIGVNFNKLA